MAALDVDTSILVTIIIMVGVVLVSIIHEGARLVDVYRLWAGYLSQGFLVGEATSSAVFFISPPAPSRRDRIEEKRLVSFPARGRPYGTPLHASGSDRSSRRP